MDVKRGRRDGTTNGTAETELPIVCNASKQRGPPHDVTDGHPQSHRQRRRLILYCNSNRKKRATDVCAPLLRSTLFLSDV